MKRQSLWIGLAAGLMSAAAFAAAPQQIPAVATAKVQQVESVTPRRYAGVVEAIEHVDLIPRVTGNLLKIHFSEGDVVQKGDLLYEIEDTTYRASVERLKAQKKQLLAALNYATQEYDRSTRLLEKNAVSVSDHDRTLMEIDMAKAKIQEIDASLIDAENNLSYTKIYAPLTGRISKSSWTVGNLLAPQGGKLADIEMIAPIYVRFSISERTFREVFGGLNGIKKSAQVRVQLADGTIADETAAVTLCSNKINSTTNTITLWATFQNQDSALLPGGYVTVLLAPKSTRRELAIVPSALITGADGYKVYVVNAQNVVEERKVTTGAVAGNRIVITEGLDGSETIIADGMHKVRPGMTVQPQAK